MSKYSVEITGINTNKLPRVTNKEMNELFIKYQQGDEKAKDTLIEGNLRLVLSILKKYNGDKHNLDDLFQIGVIGLAKAVINFDLSFNCQFSTYAVPLISGEIKRYVRDNTTLRVSRSIKDRAYQILRFKEEYIKKYNKEPSIEEIKKELSLTDYEISNALISLNDVQSIYEPIYNDGGDTIYLYDTIADRKENNYDKDNLISLKKGLEHIKKRESEILEKRYVIGKTQMEIAEELNISQAQVSRIEKGAILKLKRYIK